MQLKKTTAEYLLLLPTLLILLILSILLKFSFVFSVNSVAKINL